jgi:XTP/dITP diphosphohydrolase
MQKIILATSNSGKIREISEILAPMECLSQKDYDIPSPAETGQTFIENAIIKARHASLLSGLPALADDSGLVIPALNDAPGIFSARFAGDGANDRENLNLVLQKIKQKKLTMPTAYFYCAIALIQHPNSPTPLIATGELQGKISDYPRGANGFGYDPIFYLEEYQCTLAELDQFTKNVMSHRFLALHKLKLDAKSFF